MGILTKILGYPEIPAGFFDEQPQAESARNAMLQTQIAAYLSGTNDAYGSWNDQNFSKQATAAYLNNVIGRRCVDEIARAVAGVQWAMYKDNADGQRENQPNHWMYELFKRPNPNSAWPFLMYETVAFLLLNGNSYLRGIGPMTGRNQGRVKELYVKRPDRMTVVPAQKGDDGAGIGKIAAYKWHGDDGKTITYKVDKKTQKSEILHFMLYHPTNDYYGASIARTAGKEIDASNEIVQWQGNLIRREGRPGLMIESPQIMGDLEYDRLKKSLRDNYGGFENAGRNLILEGGAKGSPYNWSPREMDHIESNREMSRRISLAWGVPPQKLGIPGDNTYSNLKEADLHFYEGTVLWYLDYMRGEFNYWLFSEDDAYMDYNRENITALEPRRELQWERAQKSDFLTINEKRALTGMEKVSNGDVILTPASMTTLDAIDDEPEAVDEQAEQEERKAIADLVKAGYTELEAAGMITTGINE